MSRSLRYEHAKGIALEIKREQRAILFVITLHIGAEYLLMLWIRPRRISVKIFSLRGQLKKRQRFWEKTDER
jgi:hypothetical protein